jgi:hypothetical protein
MTQYDTIAQLHAQHMSVDQIIAQTGFKKSTVLRDIYDIEHGRKLKRSRRRSHHSGKYSPLPSAPAIPILHIRPKYPEPVFGPPVECREMYRVNIATGGVRCDRRGEVAPWLAS